MIQRTDIANKSLWEEKQQQKTLHFEAILLKVDFGTKILGWTSSKQQKFCWIIQLKINYSENLEVILFGIAKSRSLNLVLLSANQPSANPFCLLCMFTKYQVFPTLPFI